MRERENLRSWASDVIQKAELYGQAAIGVLHAELRETLRGMYKADPNLHADSAARIAADRVITKFASGTKMHTEALASYLKSRGHDGVFAAASQFAEDVKSAMNSANGAAL